MLLLVLLLLLLLLNLIDFYYINVKHLNRCFLLIAFGHFLNISNFINYTNYISDPLVFFVYTYNKSTTFSNGNSTKFANTALCNLLHIYLLYDIISYLNAFIILPSWYPFIFASLNILYTISYFILLYLLDYVGYKFVITVWIG